MPDGFPITNVGNDGRGEFGNDGRGESGMTGFASRYRGINATLGMTGAFRFS